MNDWGANHGAISYGHIGADLITLASILRIPVVMHNVDAEQSSAPPPGTRSEPPIPKAPTTAPAPPSARCTASGLRPRHRHRHGIVQGRRGRRGRRDPRHRQVAHEISGPVRGGRSTTPRPGGPRCPRSAARSWLPSANRPSPYASVASARACTRDAEGRPVRAAILYGIDSRATREIAELTGDTAPIALLARSGTLLSSSGGRPQAALAAAQRAGRLGARPDASYGEQLLSRERLTGEYVLDHHSASQCDPLYEIQTNRWADGLGGRVAPGSSCRDCVWPAEVVGTSRSAAAAEPA